MRQDIIDLFDDFTHGTMARRTFLKRLAALAGSAAAASALLPVLENDYARAAVVAADDPSIIVEKTSFPAGQGSLQGYLAEPLGQGPYPAVLVIHENRGLNPHIEDIARRFAKAGFVALAPDMLSPLGGTPADEDKAREMIYTLDAKKTLAGLEAGVEFLAKAPYSNGHVGAVGFCWGGGMANALAVAAPQALKAVVAYYGRQPAADEVASIKAAMMLHYGGLDQRINAGIPAFEEALKRYGIDYQMFVYPGANHAFNNDTNAARYNKPAADLAWRRTLDFLASRLKK